MKILLVNDDGYLAEGISVLDKALSKAGHEVWVCAPESQRSACSHVITLRNRVKIVRTGERHFYCTGFPADCVLYALRGAIPEMKTPDVVISGINKGFNVSTDLVYSGTVAAAEEGVLRGCRSIAVSCGSSNRVDEFNGVFAYRDAAEFTVKHLEDFVKICPDDVFININVPVNSNQRWTVTDMGVLQYFDRAVSVGTDDTYEIHTDAPCELVSGDDTDFERVVRKNIISVSAVKVHTSVHEPTQRMLYDLMHS